MERRSEIVIGLALGLALAAAPAEADQPSPLETLNADSSNDRKIILSDDQLAEIHGDVQQVELAEAPIFPTETPEVVEVDGGEQIRVLIQTSFMFPENIDNTMIDELVSQNGNASLTMEQLNQVYSASGIESEEAIQQLDDINLFIEFDPTLSGSWDTDNENKVETRANLININGRRGWTVENKIVIDGVIGPDGLPLPVNSQALIYTDENETLQVYYIADTDGEDPQTQIGVSGQLLEDGRIVPVTTRFNVVDNVITRQAIVAVDENGSPYLHENPDGEDQSRYVNLVTSAETTTQNAEQIHHPEFSVNNIDRLYFRGNPIPFGNLTRLETTYGGNNEDLTELIENITYFSGYHTPEDIAENLSLLSGVIISEPYMRDGVYYFDIGFPNTNGNGLIAVGSAFLGEHGNSRITRLPENYNYDPSAVNQSGPEIVEGLVGQQVIIQTKLYDFSQNVADRERFQLYIQNQQTFLAQGGIEWLENSLETNQFSQGLLGSTTEIFYDRN